VQGLQAGGCRLAAIPHPRFARPPHAVGRRMPSPASGCRAARGIGPRSRGRSR
jgi:hypothetical protein